MKISGVVKTGRLFGLLALLAGLLAACGDSTGTAPAANSGGTRLKVVATTTQIGDFVKNVGGSRVELTTILKPGADAHEYEPTAADSKALVAAQVIFSNGLGLDDWLQKTIDNSGTKAALVVTSAGVKTRQSSGEHSEEFKEGDPHIWFNTDNAKKMVDNVAAGLSKADPAGASAYQTAATAYKEQLDTLQKQIKEQVETIPAGNRKLVTNHDAFGYYIEQFGLTFVGAVIPSLDSTAEPSAKEIQDLVNKIKDQKVKAIFTEQSINPKLAEQLSREAGVKIFSNLYSDSLGEAGSDGDTYIKMMQSNTKNIVNGLK